MRIIKAGHEIIDEPSLVKKIERIARICYKSEDLIKEGSAEKMIANLLERNHTAMLEHGSLIFEVDAWTMEWLRHICNDCRPVMLMDGKVDNVESVKLDWEENSKYYLRFTELYSEKDMEYVRYIVSGNMRTWQDVLYAFTSYEAFPFELNEAIKNATDGVFGIDINPDDYQGLVDHITLEDGAEKPKVYAKLMTAVDLTPGEQMIHVDETVIFTTNRGITHELVRMRACSFAQESTRYCRYSNNKFGNEITVIDPCYWEHDSNAYKIWKNGCEQAEGAYFELLDEGAQAQEARDVLPTSLKADIGMTTNLLEWRHIFNLRACDSTGPAHAAMHEIMVPYFKKMREKYPFAFGDMNAFDEV